MKQFTKYFLVACFMLLSSQFSWAEFKNFSILIDNSEKVENASVAEKTLYKTKFQIGVHQSQALQSRR